MARKWRRILGVGALVGAGVMALRSVKWFLGSPEGVGREDLAAGAGMELPFEVDERTLGGEVSPELLARLVCPLDKGPLVLVDGKWLVNPRNGYRYPIADGIPVMMIEVGERYRDPSLITEPAPVTDSAEARQGGLL